jgi:Zn-dependent protease with chaperone function
MREPWTQLQQLLPSWVSWFCMVVPLLAGPWAWLTTRLSIATAVRVSARSMRAQASEPLHWTQRARLLWPARAAARLSTASCALAAMILPLLSSGPLQRVPALACAVLGFVCAYAGGWVAAASLGRREGGFRAALRGALTACFVLYAHVFVAVVASALLPTSITRANAWQFALTLALVTACSAGLGLLPARLFGLVQPASPHVQACVARAASALGHTPRAVVSIELGAANALAFPLLGWIAVSTRLEQQLDADELTAVAAHELTHLTEPRWVRVARVLIPATALAWYAAGGVIQVHLGNVGWLTPLALTALLVALVWRRMSRKLEARADAGAHASLGYARALEKIYQANLMPAVMRRARSHPHLYDRLQAAGATLDYPRPEPPPRLTVPIGVLFVLLFAYVVAPAAMLQLAGEGGDESSLHARLAATGGAAWELGELGRRAREQERFDDAALLFSGAGQLAPNEVYYAVQRLDLLVQARRCEEARAELGSMRQRPDLSQDMRSFLDDQHASIAGCGVYDFTLSLDQIPTPTVTWGDVELTPTPQN